MKAREVIKILENKNEGYMSLMMLLKDKYPKVFEEGYMSLKMLLKDKYPKVFEEIMKNES